MNHTDPADPLPGSCALLRNRPPHRREGRFCFRPPTVEWTRSRGAKDGRGHECTPRAAAMRSKRPEPLPIGWKRGSRCRSDAMKSSVPHHDLTRSARGRTIGDVILADDSSFADRDSDDDQRRNDQHALIGQRDEPVIIRGRTAQPIPAAIPETAPTGLPAEQLHAWWEWLQQDLSRLDARLDFLMAARATLRDQERLLRELAALTAPRP